MADCLLTPLNASHGHCRKCDPAKLRPIPLGHFRDCPGAPLVAREPDFAPAADRLGISLADAVHYGQALARWTMAGFPVRSAEAVATIYREHCESCDQNRGGRCAQCGCHVATSGLPVANKIAMATERCPEKKW